MRRSGSTFFGCLALIALGSAAGAQELPSVPAGPGFLPPVQVSSGLQTVQFTVDVIGHAPPMSGSVGDNFLSFSSPVQFPGVSLGPGTYLLRLVGSSVMQVSSADRTRSYAMFIVVPAERSEASGNHGVVLQRTNDGAPMRLVGLFMPNSRYGYEPIYAKPSSCERILRNLNLPTTICASL